MHKGIGYHTKVAGQMSLPGESNLSPQRSLICAGLRYPGAVFLAAVEKQLLAVFVRVADRVIVS